MTDPCILTISFNDGYCPTLQTCCITRTPPGAGHPRLPITNAHKNRPLKPPPPPAPSQYRSHPWVTLGDTAPLPSASSPDGSGAPAPPAAALSLSQAEIDSAIRLADGPMRERVEAVFKERRYGDGEVLVAPGDDVDTVFLIASGEVEIVAPPPLLDGPAAQQPLITGMDTEGLECRDLEEGADPFEEQALLLNQVELSSSPDTRASVALIGEVITAGHRHSHPLPAPLEAQGAPQQQWRPQGASGEQQQQQAVWDGERQVLAVKGPGDSLGLPSLLEARDHEEHRWRVFCRARGAVTAFAARVRDLQLLVVHHPEMEPAVQQIAMQQETDMAVAEAMRRLRIHSFSGCCSTGGGGGAGAGAGMRSVSDGGGFGSAGKLPHLVSA